VVSIRPSGMWSPSTTGPKGCDRGPKPEKVFSVALTAPDLKPEDPAGGACV